MEDDKIAENFSNSLFTYLWCTHNFIPESNVADAINEMSEFTAEVAKAVVALSSLTVPTFNEGIESYFAKHGMSRESVFRFLATYCFNYHARNNDIFAVVLKTCTFVYKVVIFCHCKGLVEYLDFASMCWAEIFKYDLKEEFYEKGGWEELERYVIAKYYPLKHKISDHKAFITFVDDINCLFPKLKVEEDKMNISDSVDKNSTDELEKQSLRIEDSVAHLECQDSAHFSNSCLSEPNFSVEEVVSAYKLLTSFYGPNFMNMIVEHTADEPLSTDCQDIERVYKTLSSLLNQGLLQFEAATGKIIPPNLIQHANLHKAMFCHSNCQQETRNTFTNHDAVQTNICQSYLERNENNLCKIPDECLDSK